MTPRTSPRARGAAGVSLLAAVALAATAVTLPARAAESGPARAAIDQSPTIVGLGDSYMSGEGVMYANHNFSSKDPSDKDSNWQTGAGFIGGDVGTPSDPTQVGNTWLSVFGDANGFPTTGGRESIPFCDRSFAAAMNIGVGWNSVNLACSGAVLGTVPRTKNDLFKPGIDFAEYDNPAPFVAKGYGQARMLQDYAARNGNVRAVVLSIGGNDFGFGKIASACIQGNNAWSRCENDKDVQAIIEAGVPAAEESVAQSIHNITQAMAAAGYDQHDWKLIYQNPPLPVGPGSDTKYSDSGGPLSDRNVIGGCGLYNSTLNWITGTVYPQLTAAMKNGVRRAKSDLGKTQVTILDTTDTFAGHRLCGKQTQGATAYRKGQAGKTPPWQADNGQGTEWVTYISRTEMLRGNIYQQQMPLHPNYWGQRALASCVAAALAYRGAFQVSCTQDGTALDREGRPAMKLGDPDMLWIMATGRPVIQGVPNPGRTLSVDPVGTFAPDVEYAYSYQWYEDGAEIPGATDATYTPTLADLYSRITVKVTAAMLGSETVSDQSLSVRISDFEVVQPPSVSGDEKVGATLTADPGAYNPSPPDSVAYQWARDGHAVSGATAATYALTGPDQGHRMSVQVTAERSGYAPITLNTAQSGVIGEGQLSLSGTPTAAGETVVGQTLAADTTAVTVTPQPDRVTYQWYRDGAAVTGARQQTYDLTGDDVGARLSVLVSGHKEGYREVASQQSAPTGVVTRGTIRALKVPEIRYVDPMQALTPIPGRRIAYGRDTEIDLTGVFSQWTNTPDVIWYRDTGSGPQPIPGTGGSEYHPVAADFGARLSARITTTDPGYEEATAVTDTYLVVQGKRQVAQAPTLTRKAKVGRVLTATKARFSPGTSRVTYRWLRNGKRIRGALGRHYRPVRADRGTRLRVQAKAAETTRYAARTVKSAPSRPVRRR